jgi:hypothetical protein
LRTDNDEKVDAVPDYAACRQAMEEHAQMDEPPPMDAETVTRFRMVIGRLARDLNASATDKNLTLTQASVLASVNSRSARVTVTDEGRLVQQHIKAARAAIISRCLARLPAESRAGLVAALPGMEALSVEIRAASTGQRTP